MKEPTLETVVVGRILPPPRNPNVMGDYTFELLCEAIRSVGFLQPVLLRRVEGTDDLEIVDGVHRIKAAKKVGLTTVPAVVVEAGVSNAVALQIGMNRMRGELDLAQVAESLVELAKAGWSSKDLELTGFTSVEVDDLIASVRPEDERDILAGAELPEDDDSVADEPEGVFILEIGFARRSDMARAKKRLKKVGDGDLAQGLLALISGEED